MMIETLCRQHERVLSTATRGQLRHSTGHVQPARVVRVSVRRKIATTSRSESVGTTENSHDFS